MAAASPNWMMLERFVFRGDDAAAESFLDEEAATFSASHVSGCSLFTITFRIVEPPGISRLYLRWPSGLPPNKGSSCDLVAAHGNLLLFRLTSIPLAVNKDDSPFYPQEYFICRVPSLPCQPQLTLQRIPMCTKPLVLRGNKDKVITTQRTFHPHSLGILCRGKEEFAMAHLSLSRPYVLGDFQADLCVFRSNTHNCNHMWELEEQLLIQYTYDESLDLVYWKTDMVIAFNNSLGWVDFCSGGILFCDVFQKRPTISYLRLPIDKRNPGGFKIRHFHDMHRSVCITKGGHELNFIDVVREDGRHVGPMSPGTGFTVTCYALRTTESGSMDWNKVFFLKSDEVGGLKMSPSQALTFPLVSLDKPNIVHFLLSERVCNGINKVWVVTVDISAKEMVSIRPYIKGKEDLKGKDSEMVKQRSYMLQPFMHSELSKFLYPTSSNKGVKKTTKTKSGSQVSATPKRPRSTRNRDPSLPMAAASLNWMMLDRFVFRRDAAATESFLDEEASSFTIQGCISPGDPFSVSFRIAKPPEISRLYLKWPRGTKEGPGCFLMAAHRNLLLLWFTPDPVKIDEPPYALFTEHLFICRTPCLRDDPLYGSPLVLQRIPMCTIPVVLHVKKNGTEITMQRRFELNTVGILCHGEEEFAVAQLVLCKPLKNAKMEAQLCVLRSSINNHDHKWELEKELPILYEADEILDLDAWSTHRIIPFNRYLCWVNYGVGGVLFCEVFQERPNISYLRLPIHNRCRNQRQILDRKCSLCVTKGYFGAHELTFVDVARKDGYLVGPLSPHTGFTVAYHVLRRTESSGMKWDMVFFLTSAELWELNKSLPHEALTFPHVSMDEPNVVHFLMSEQVLGKIDKVSVVTIDMSTSQVLSVVPYIEDKDIKGKDPIMVRQTSSYLQSFLPSELPKFMNPTCKNVFGSTSAAAARTPASPQVNISTGEISVCPAFSTRSRTKRY